MDPGSRLVDHQHGQAKTENGEAMHEWSSAPSPRTHSLLYATQYGRLLANARQNGSIAHRPGSQVQIGFSVILLLLTGTENIR